MKIITENPGLQVKKFMIKYPIITRKEQQYTLDETMILLNFPVNHVLK